jgi:hypothetical protein
MSFLLFIITTSTLGTTWNFQPTFRQSNSRWGISIHYVTLADLHAIIIDILLIPDTRRTPYIAICTEYFADDKIPSLTSWVCPWRAESVLWGIRISEGGLPFQFKHGTRLSLSLLKSDRSIINENRSYPHSVLFALPSKTLRGKSPIRERYWATTRSGHVENRYLTRCLPVGN